MTSRFGVEVLSFSNILEIDGARTEKDFAVLLEAMEYGDQSGLNGAELREMCLLSLQGLKPVDAAYLVLKHDMGDVLRDGQIRNLASEMLDEKLWEEYANSSLHERLFNTGSLLYAAFPQSFPEPDAVRVVLQVKTVSTAATALLIPAPHESLLVRLLADGMDGHAALHRLFGDELGGKSFPTADEIVWIVRAEPIDEVTAKLEVISSGYWLDALNRTDFYESSAYADETRPPRPPH